VEEVFTPIIKMESVIHVPATASHARSTQTNVPAVSPGPSYLQRTSPAQHVVVGILSTQQTIFALLAISTAKLASKWRPPAHLATHHCISHYLLTPAPTAHFQSNTSSPTTTASNVMQTVQAAALYRITVPHVWQALLYFSILLSQ
jgi:hypothetical protein